MFASQAPCCVALKSLTVDPAEDTVKEEGATENVANGDRAISSACRFCHSITFLLTSGAVGTMGRGPFSSQEPGRMMSNSMTLASSSSICSCHASSSSSFPSRIDFGRPRTHSGSGDGHIQVANTYFVSWRSNSLQMEAVALRADRSNQEVQPPRPSQCRELGQFPAKIRLTS